MFVWTHYNLVEVDVPLERVKEIGHMKNCSHWVDDIESCECEEPLVEGSVIKAKIKNRNLFVSIIVTSCIATKNTYSEIGYLMKTFLFKQESLVILTPSSSDKTRIETYTHVRSILCPFLKRLFKKRVDLQNAKINKYLLDNK